MSPWGAPGFRPALARRFWPPRLAGWVREPRTPTSSAVSRGRAASSATTTPTRECAARWPRPRRRGTPAARTCTSSPCRGHGPRCVIVGWPKHAATGSEAGFGTLGWVSPGGLDPDPWGHLVRGSHVWLAPVDVAGGRNAAAMTIVATHELGHVLGLGHSTRCATMDAAFLELCKRGATCVAVRLPAPGAR